MKKRGWIILSLCLLLGGGTTCYFLFAGEKEDPKLAPLKAELKNIESQNLSPQQAMTARMQVFEKSRNLSENSRHELFRAAGQAMRKRMDERMNAYFSAPPEKQKAVLDQHIREMEAFFKQMRERRQQGGGPGGQRGEGMGRGGPGGGRQRWENATPEQRNQMRKQHMEHGNPQARSRGMEYMRAIQDRRKELGLPAMGPHRH